MNTLRELEVYLPTELSELILSYITPVGRYIKSDDYCHTGFYEKCMEIEDVRNCLFKACRGGHMDIVMLVISKGSTEWDSGLNGACRSGDMDIIQLMIQKGATNWHIGLRSACLGGHIDVVNLMISKGADNWNVGLCEACIGGHMNIAKLMIKNGADDINTALTYACHSKDIDTIMLMIKLGANNWDYCLAGACLTGDLMVADIMISRGASDWLRCIKIAVSGDRIEIIRFLIENRDKICRSGDYSWNEVLTQACKCNKEYAINMIIDMGANECHNPKCSGHVYNI